MNRTNKGLVALTAIAFGYLGHIIYHIVKSENLRQEKVQLVEQYKSCLNEANQLGRDANTISKYTNMYKPNLLKARECHAPIEDIITNVWNEKTKRERECEDLNLNNKPRIEEIDKQRDIEGYAAFIPGYALFD